MKTKERFYSLDVFRGATIALMIMVNNPGSWSHIYQPLDHSEWHGITPTDLVFPFFLFIVGSAFAFVMPRLRAGGSAAFWKKILKRSVLIFLIGLFLAWFPFVRWQGDSLLLKTWEWQGADGSLNGIRILGVLQRIAIAYFLAAIIIYYFKLKGSLIIAGILLLGYWGLCYFMNPADPYGFYGWFGTHVDMSILGEPHMYHGEVREGKRIAFDPEGFMSSFAPVAQVILGYACGEYIVRKGKTAEMVNGLFVAGALMMLLGYLWGLTFPINKKIWTSSYAVLTSGMAMTIIAVMVYFIELKSYRKGWLTGFFDSFGKNPLFIYILSGVVVRISSLIRIPQGMNADGKMDYTTPLSWFYEHICKPVFPDNLKNGSLLYAVIFILALWVIAYWMDKKKIYVKV